MVSKIIFIALTIVAIYTRYKNTCECNDDKEIKYDILQIVIISIISLFMINVTELIKFIGVILISYVIKSIIKFLTKPKITYTRKNSCDCKNGFRF